MLNITVDNFEETVNITWWSNSSGSWEIFGTNNSVGKGTYHQVLSNASINGQWWYWKVNVSDGETFNESSVFSFYTGYESQINNSGVTNISGYLSMKIDFYNNTSEEWELEQNVTKDTTPRTINSGCLLALDTIFNERMVNTNSFTHGNGTYRVYAAFCDTYEEVMKCDDDFYLEDSYEFSVTYE